MTRFLDMFIFTLVLLGLIEFSSGKQQVQTNNVECTLLKTKNRCLVKDVVDCGSYECVRLDSIEVTEFLRVKLREYHGKDLCLDRTAVPTCSNQESGACSHVEDCFEASEPSEQPKKIFSFDEEQEETRKDLTQRKLSLSRILKFDDLNTLLGCATIDVGTAMQAAGGYVVDYTSESCTGETCAPSWLGGGCCCNLCAGLRAQVWDVPCKNFQFGDITIQMLSSTSTTYKLRLGFTNIQGSCTMKWKYWTTGNVPLVSDIDSGINTADVGISGASAYIDIDVMSSNFNSRPPSDVKVQSKSFSLSLSLSLTDIHSHNSSSKQNKSKQIKNVGCTASVSVSVDVDLGGTISNFFGNALVDVITGTLNSMAQTIICSLVAGYSLFGSDVVDPMLENLIKSMLTDINTMLSYYDYDLDQYTVAARNAEQNIDVSNVNLVDVETEKLFSVLREILDKVLSEQITNEYGNNDISLNQILRGATRYVKIFTHNNNTNAHSLTYIHAHIYSEGMFVFEAEDLDSETRMLFDSQSIFMDIALRLNRVEISNLDKFSAVDLLVVLRNLLGTNEAMSTYEQTSHEGLGVSIELTLAMQPPSGETQAVTFSCGANGIAYNTRLQFTINAIELALVILTAIDKDKFDSITFFDLINQTAPCVADIFVDNGFGISSVYANIASMTDPVVSGIGDVDLQNLMNTAVEILFDMYGPFLFSRLPSIVDYYIKNITGTAINDAMDPYKTMTCELPDELDKIVWTCSSGFKGTFSSSYI